jgi:glucose-6-phosphate 1-dehydrogenase
MTSTAIKERTDTKATRAPEPAGPCILVIFGAAGDLTKRKLVPALYNLALNGLLPSNFAIVGVARADKNDQAFRDELNEAMKQFATSPLDAKKWSWFEERLYYLRGNFEDADTYTRLKERLIKIDQEHGTENNCLYYLATAEDYFDKIIENLNLSGLSQESEKNWRHVIIEKPFGNDLDSACALNRKILAVLKESQIYRIDHYLGKETVQNLMVFRFGNAIFEPAWNSRYIDHVQITVAESVGIEGRGGFYEKAGALRDFVPNHLFQLVSLIAMEPPSCFDADAVRDKKTEVLTAIHPFTEDDVRSNAVRGQYGAGIVTGKSVIGYRSENRVAADSNVETYVALKLSIDNWRWAGVPFYLRTGKALPKRATEIAIQFKNPPIPLFRDEAMDLLSPNFLIMHIQPNEGISLQLGAKIPGPTVRIGQVKMNFCYKDNFGVSPSTGYETLIYDCMIGDPTLFQRADGVEAGWKVVKPIQELWSAERESDFPNYSAGTWGPSKAAELLTRDGRQWRLIDDDSCR